MKINDMGDYGDAYYAVFYGTIKEPDSHIFLRYLKENNVKIEEEYLPLLPGRFGFVGPLRISKYRKL